MKNYTVAEDKRGDHGFQFTYFASANLHSFSEDMRKSSRIS